MNPFRTIFLIIGMSNIRVNNQLHFTSAKRGPSGFVKQEEQSIYFIWCFLPFVVVWGGDNGRGYLDYFGGWGNISKWQ